MSQPGFCHENELLSNDIFEKECDFSFHMIYYLYSMPVINLMLCWSKKVILNLCKIILIEKTEGRS